MSPKWKLERTGLSEHEQRALLDIHAWKCPELHWIDRFAQSLNQPFNKVGEALIGMRGIGAAIERVVSALVGLSNDAARWSVRPQAVYGELRRAGYDVSSSEDLLALDLAAIDGAMGRLATKYRTLALIEGGAAGAAGLPGLPLDIVALLTLNLRAIGEYATYCGFDLNDPAERLFALNVLVLASSPSDATKEVAMAQVVKIAKEITKNVTMPRVEGQVVVFAVRQLARVLGVRLTKAKLAQLVPLAGAAVGGGFNAYQTGRVCEAAFHLYRERFLAAKYGVHLIEETVTPAGYMSDELAR